MKILIVEDSKLNRVFLSKALAKYGYDVIEAEDGSQGVALFSSETPDLVLMDLMMPVMDGYTATKAIKELSGDKFTPIIVLTALTDTDSLVKAIEHGADDYLTKPYNTGEIRAKIVALGRIANLHDVINKNRDELLLNKEKMDEDISVAEHIYKSVLNLENKHQGFIKNKFFSGSPFSGELLLCSHTPSGDIHILSGEFSGHGLSASIGAIPTSEAFYGMTEKGFSIADIAYELNSKIKALLPENMHCNICFIEIDKQRSAIGLWNSGMPDVVIRSADGKLVNCQENKAALGTVSDEDFDRQLDIIPISGNEKLFMCNRALLDVISNADDEFSSSKYKAIHDSLSFDDVSLDEIISRVRESSGDDINDSRASLIEVGLDRALDSWSADKGGRKFKSTPSSSWTASVCFDASCLKAVNPVPALLDIIMNIQAPNGHKERIFTILTELFSNAQEHGLLGLDSSLKSSPTGFAEYYAEREKLLRELDDGEISVSIKHTPNNGGGMFTIVIKDSGPGFDLGMLRVNINENTGFSGRGMPLIRSMSDDLSYNEVGNEATVVYSWCE